RYHDLVGRLPGHVARQRTEDVQVLHELVQIALDLGHGRDWLGLLGRRTLTRKGALVERLRGRVVDRERAVRDYDLGVTVLALELEAHLMAGRGHPQAPARPAQDRVAALDGARVDQVVGELDPGGDAADRGCVRGLMKGLGERLARRSRTT